MPENTLLVVMVALLAASCGDHSETCAEWASASCPADYPNLQQGLDEAACLENFDFNCGEDCTSEYEALIACQTQNPNCCNETDCNNGSLTVCASVDTAWSDCTQRVRNACEE